jgi:hypothetical protein
MATIRLSARVGSDRKLTLNLPNEIPPGEIEIVVRSLAGETDDDIYDATAKVTLQYTNMATEIARAKLQEVGKLAQSTSAPDDAVLLPPDELWAVGAKALGKKGKAADKDKDKGDQ